MKLHNTATKKVTAFSPQQEGKVSLYTCGPTVYSSPQIGNWAMYLRWDILVRTLRALQLEVNWVMNITDVGHLTDDADEGEDKMEKGARREGKTAWEVAEIYTQEFLAGMEAFNILAPTQLQKATDHIPEQIALIEKLEQKGLTYRTDDGIYFNTSRFADYGKMAHLQLDKLQAGARVEFNPQKKNITDFALWKFTPQGTHRDMEWPSPWGAGFPGWHLECSAIAMAHLGDTLDIHAGGIDHIPVHHTNEIAQSEAATGKPFARFWVHGNFITVNGTKLSKSLNNSFVLTDIDEHGFLPDDFRMLILQSHYRTEADFTWESLAAARNRRLNWQAVADLRWQPTKARTAAIDATKTYEAILDQLANDLDTPRALVAIEEFLQTIEKDGIGEDQLPQLLSVLQGIDALLGTKLAESKDITNAQKQLIGERLAAREAKDFSKADDIRSLLLEQHIELHDTPTGTRWSRTA